MRRYPLRGCAALACAAALGLVAMPAAAQVFRGVETSTFSGQTGTTTGGTFLSATVTGTSGGGDGTDFDSRTYSIGEGTAFAEADADGNAGVGVASPLLRASSTADTSSSGSQSFAGALVPYQYTGVAPGLVTYNYTLTADLNEPTDTDHAAFVRARGGLVVDPEFFTTSVNDYFESSSFPEDTFDEISSVDGPVLRNGSVSFTADPGQVFHLVMSVVTQAGHTPAFSDASSTLSGDFTSPGGMLVLIPEPAAGALLLAGLGLTMLRRRKRA